MMATYERLNPPLPEVPTMSCNVSPKSGKRRLVTPTTLQVMRSRYIKETTVGDWVNGVGFGVVAI